MDVPIVGFFTLKNVSFVFGSRIVVIIGTQNETVVRPGEEYINCYSAACGLRIPSVVQTIRDRATHHY